MRACLFIPDNHQGKTSEQVTKHKLEYNTCTMTGQKTEGTVPSIYRENYHLPAMCTVVVV